MANVNAIMHPSFTGGLFVWKKQGWYTGNTVDIYSRSDGEGHCVRLGVPAELGQAYIYQRINVKPGNYNLTFEAKKDANCSVDLWAQFSVDNVWQYGRSLAKDLTTSWQTMTVPFSVSGSGYKLVQIRIIAGSVPGGAWIDNVSVQVDSENCGVSPDELKRGTGTITATKTKVRNAPNGDTARGHWNPNAKFILLETVAKDGYDWYKTIWGKSGVYAFVRADCASYQSSYFSYAYDRIVDLAASFIGQKGSSTEIESAFQFSGDWCQSFVNAMFYQSDPSFVTAGKILNSSNTAENVQWFKQRNRWYEPTDIPQKGDWVYFLWEDDESDGLTSSHVGIVESVNTTLRTMNTIEGNRTDGETDTKVVVRKYNIPYSDFEGSRVIGYGRPDYTVV